jgi:regulator of protease activity HflC (stomatin/prohibitin superfamily)
MKNEYLDQVMQEQAVVAEELKAKRAYAPRGRRQAAVAQHVAFDAGGGPPQVAARGADIRITGVLRWKTVIVPPNYYVVHTRRGHDEPVHMGLGTSFRFNPATDSFLVVPSAMQTIAINARCICKEKQGVLVQAYVQWIIDDIGTAYRKLDFSDDEDPMRVVNVQLREQAEAAIKDKVATMGVAEVLSDKQPIIEELTARLTEIVQGSEASGGLGLKIVTVQIKEAVVSSPRVWEALQRPFRAEQQRIARLAELENEAVVEKAGHAQELSRYARELEAQLERKQREVELAEHRAALEQKRMELEIAELEAKLSLEAARSKLRMAELEAQIQVDDRAHAAAHAREALDLGNAERRREIENMVSRGRVDEKLLEVLPAVAEKLPSPEKLVQISGDGGHIGLTGLVAGVREVLTNGVA